VNVSTPSQYGTIYISTDRNITLNVFGGASYGGNNTGYLSVTGYNGTATPSVNSISVYAANYVNASNNLGLPAGYYQFYLHMSPVGTSGPTASITCGDVITYVPTPSPSPSGGGGGGGGGLSGYPYT
jgi:hypothetical protein